MRFLFFSIVIFNITFGVANAQTFKGGIIGGFNLSQIDGDELAGFNKIGINGGLYTSAVISERWQLSMELLFAQQGSKQNPNDAFYSRFDKIHFNLVEVPIMINFIEWKFHVQGGFSYARLINKKIIEVNGEDVSDATPIEENMYSLNLGVTYFSSDNLGFNFRWAKSLDNVNADPGGNKYLNRSLSFRVLYLFN